jgi:hypothetical protein
LPDFTIFICLQSYGNSVPQSKQTTYVFVDATSSARPEECAGLVVMGNEQCLWEQRNSELTNLNIVTSVARLAAAIVDEVERERKTKSGRSTTVNEAEMGVICSAEETPPPKLSTIRQFRITIRFSPEATA